MKRLLASSVLVAASIMVSAPVLAAGGLQLKGSGTAQNNNSGVGFDLLTEFKLEGVKATGPAVGGVYPAKGKVKATNVIAADPDVTLASGKGVVACIANLGPSTWGGNAAVDVWEIRIGPGVHPVTGAPNSYASFFFQDDGLSDWEDENFDPSNASNPSCGVVTAFALEPIIKGKFVVVP